MLILITNDDGYQAPGIHALVEALSGLGRLIVVAPDGPRSGASRSFTSAVPVRVRRVEGHPAAEWYSCTGTPVDCVKVAYEAVIPRRPDLLVSGINLGDNASVSVHYSGTMGAAIEGCIKHTPSIGFSLATFDPSADFTPTLPLVRQVAEEVLRTGLPEGECLNVNFPVTPTIKGLRHCRPARGEWVEECFRCEAPRDGDWYWFTGRYVDLEPEATDTDMAALRQGYASITTLAV